LVVGIIENGRMGWWKRIEAGMMEEGNLAE